MEEEDVEMWKGKQESREAVAAGAEMENKEQHKGDDVDVTPVGGAEEHLHGR